MPKKLIIKETSWKEKIIELAQPQIKFGRPTKRKCLCLGKVPYYWKNAPVAKLAQFPEIRELIPIADLEDWSILINVYENSGEGIGWHIDSTKELANCVIDDANIFSMSIPIDDNIDKRTPLVKMSWSKTDISKVCNTSVCGLNTNGVAIVYPKMLSWYQPVAGLNEINVNKVIGKSMNLCSEDLIGWRGQTHEYWGLKHQAKTLIPRINITCRRLKDK